MTPRMSTHRPARARNRPPLGGTEATGRRHRIDVIRPDIELRSSPSRLPHNGPGNSALIRFCSGLEVAARMKDGIREALASDGHEAQQDEVEGERVSAVDLLDKGRVGLGDVAEVDKRRETDDDVDRGQRVVARVEKAVLDGRRGANGRRKRSRRRQRGRECCASCSRSIESRRRLPAQGGSWKRIRGRPCVAPPRRFASTPHLQDQHGGLKSCRPKRSRLSCQPAEITSPLSTSTAIPLRKLRCGPGSLCLAS